MQFSLNELTVFCAGSAVCGYAFAQVKCYVTDYLATRRFLRLARTQCELLNS